MYFLNVFLLHNALYFPVHYALYFSLECCDFLAGFLRWFPGFHNLPRHPMQGATKLDSPQYQEPLFRKLQEPGVRKLELEITLMTKKARLRTMSKMMKMRRRWRMSRAECCHFLPRFLHSFPGFQILLTAVPTNCARRAYMQYINNSKRYLL